MLAAAGQPLRGVAEMVLAGRYPDFRPAQACPIASGCPPGDVTRALHLPPSHDLSSCDRSLASVIATRRSGGLTRRPVSSLALATLLAAASRVPTMIPDATFAATIYPVVFGVDDVPAGAYRYDHDTHALIPIRDIEREAVAATALLQHEHSTGAALLFLVVPLSRWLATFGDRGYRGAAFTAGWLTDRLYLVAETLGLTYTATGGFAPAVIDELLAIDGTERTTFFAFAVGGARATAEHGIGSAR
jgi:SagB-type dehydrogenase family enzyme